MISLATIRVQITTRCRLIKHLPHNSVRCLPAQYFILQKYQSQTLPPSGTFALSSSTRTTQEHILNSSALSLPKISSQTLPTNEAQKHLECMKKFLDTNNLEAITNEFIDLKQKNILPTLDIYHILLQMCYKASDLNSALEIFTQMYTISPTKETYKYLLDVVEASSDHFLSLHVVKSIVNGQVPFIKSNSDKVQKKLNIKIDLDMWNSIFHSLTTPHKLYSTRDLNYFENVKELTEIFLNCNPNYHNYTEETWQLVIRALGTYPGYCKKFDKILQQIQSLDQIMKTPTIYSELICALSRKSLVNLAIENLDKLISKFNLIPSREPLYILLSYYADLGNYKKAEYLIDKYFKFVTIQSLQQQHYWHFNFSTVLMNAYVQALHKEASFHIKNLEGNNIPLMTPVELKEDNENQLGHLTKDNFTKSLFYASWKKVLDEVKSLNSKYHKDHFELMIRFHILSHQINHQEFPLNEALDMINEMRGDGIEPTFETFKILLEGYANSPKYNSSKPNLLRVENTLKIFYMMKSSGYNMNNIEIFQTILDSCIPKHERFTNINFKPIRLKIKEKINHIKDLIKIHKVKHNQKSMLTLLELYGCIHSFSEMRYVWFDLLSSGYHRNLNYYKTFIKASSQNIRESIYCLDVLRHQMSREYPPVYPDLETYDLLLKCCIKSNDLNTMKQINNEMIQYKKGKVKVNER